MGEDRVTAVLYRPKAEGRVTAAVIINSSGGVSAHTDHYYARVLAEEGMAALVVDSSRHAACAAPGNDQNRVAQSKSNADAFAGHRWLADQPWVDARRIIVMGMSRGGEAASPAALKVLRKRMRVGDPASPPMWRSRRQLQFPAARRAHHRRADLLHACRARPDPADPLVHRLHRAHARGRQGRVRVAIYPGVRRPRGHRRPELRPRRLGPAPTVPAASIATRTFCSIIAAPASA